jgi:hypothetical protein
VLKDAGKLHAVLKGGAFAVDLLAR